MICKFLTQVVKYKKLRPNRTVFAATAAFDFFLHKITCSASFDVYFV